MWHRFRRYLPVRMGGIRGQLADDEDEYREIEDEEDDDGREETSVDAPAGLFSDEDDVEEEEAGFSSARSSFTKRKPGDGEESPSRRRRRRGRTASASGGHQQPQNSPPRGKFLKRSETAPRSETRSGGGESSSKRPSSAVSARVESRKQSGGKRRPTSATPHSEGDAPNSENLTSRLSRRSSIISDLVALMVRRSSSLGFGHGGQNRGGGGLERDKDHHEEQPSSRPKEHHHGVRLDDYEMEEEPDEEDMGNLPREKILERIRHHKEIIGKVRLQPWPMRRKRRALKVARQYLQKQEAQVSKWGLYKVEMLRRGNQAWRWVKNLSIYLIPWESKIKQIESNFGSVVSSYFIFLRWVLGMNVANSLLIMAFVVVPEWLADSQADVGRLNRTRHIKEMPQKVAVHADELNSVLDFGGYLQYSYLFYGYYSHETILRGLLIAYNVPVAYVCVNLFLLVFCIFIILKKMTSNTRKSKLSSGKQEQYVFTWKAVNGWDYNIGEGETAASLAMANAIKLKEASTEYKKKFKQKLTFRKLFVRLLVNWVIFSMMFLSMVAIYKVGQITEKDTFIKQNAVSITVAAITLLFPPIFELILKLEQYRPRTALRIHLFRVLFFYLLNYFTLVYSLFVMLNTMEEEMKANELWQKEQQFLASQIRPFQYQFHIVHSPAGKWENSGNNQSFYEVVSSAVSSSTDDGQQQRMVRSRNMRNFLLFANVRNSEIRRRERRQFVQKRTRLGPKRKKRPLNARGNVPKHKREKEEELSPSRKEERDLNVLYSSKPFPGHEPPSTTPQPQSTTRPWTTVQPHFGPQMVGVFNPQIVLSGTRGQQHELGTYWESRPIAGADWGAATEAPNPLNYTSSPKIASAPMPLPYRASNYDDLCWETLIGQEIAKIVTTDLVMTIAAIMVIDFLRGLWIRYCSDWWCWDIEATFPEYGEFKVAENVLHLVNSQAMVCLGTILVPMLPLINCAKLVVVMYIRAWACMVCNVPAKQIFRASRSSNFYFWLLLAFVCMSTLPVGFVIAYKKPSKNCGPFAGQKSFYSIIGQVLEQNLPQSMVDVISYFMSPGIIFPVFLLLVLIIYFLVLLVNGLRAANSDLNKQLTLERTEEKRKIFELAKGRRQSGVSHAGISHKSRPSGESKKSSNGNGSGGNGSSGESYETAANGNGLKPLYFLNGAAKSGSRKSWHGGPIVGNGNEEKGNGEPEGILLNPLFPPPRKLIKQYSDESGGPHSPSKSPLRHATFLPSLQSVDEKIDEEEADNDSEQAEHGHTEALISKKKRTSGIEQQQLLPWLESIRRHSSAQHSSLNGSSGQGRGSLTSYPHPPIGPIEHRKSLHLSWKDRLLICIGWTDPAKLEEKLRQQMNETELEMGGRIGPKEEEKRQSPLNGQHRHSRMGMADSCGDKSQRTRTPQIPLIPLEEAEYSVPSDEVEEEDVEPEEVDEKRSSSRGETILMGAETPRIASGLSQTSSGRTSQRPISVIHNRLADLLVEEERLSSGSSAETGSQRSWFRQQPTMMGVSPIQQQQKKAASPHPLLSPKMGPSPFPTAQTTPSVVRRTSSINGALEPAKRAIIERDHVSESSPLSQRRHSPFPTEELARLSPDKRHPMSPKGQTTAGLPPTGPKIDERIGIGTVMKGGNGRRPSKESAGSGIRRMDGSGSSSLGTRPPSDDLSLLLEEPSTPIAYFRPISAENVLGQSFASSTGSDTRLQYANPYSSYAAAMCSPILPSPEGDEATQSATTPILSPVPPIPLPMVLPFLQPFQSVSTTPTTMPFQFELPKRRSSLRELTDQSPSIGQPQPSSSSSAQTAPPLPKHQQGSPAMGLKRTAAPASHGYATPTPTMQRRRPSETTAGVKLEPIYDQPLDQHRPSAGTVAGDEGGSTSGRGTMPPGYGSSPSTGSSPEFGRPKYKISSSSPGRPRREQQIQQKGHESGSSPEGSPRRRFEIRQRSNLGLGRPLRRMAGPNGNGGDKNGAKMNGNSENERKEENGRKVTPPGEKQSTV